MGAGGPRRSLPCYGEWCSHALSPLGAERGRINISGMLLLGPTAPFRRLAGPSGSMQIENMGGDEMYTKGQSELQFPGGGEKAAVSSPRDSPHSSYGFRKDHTVGGTVRDSLTSSCLPATFQASHKRRAGKPLTTGSLGVASGGTVCNYSHYN